MKPKGKFRYGLFAVCVVMYPTLFALGLLLDYALFLFVKYLINLL